MILKYVFIFWAFLASATSSTTKQLNSGWKMRILKSPQKQFDTNKEFDVSVPSTIHLNLEKHKEIPNPFTSNDMQSLKWISSCQVQFTTTIIISEQQKKSSKIKLVFDGIDTYSDIYFNEQKLGSTRNAFLKYQFPIEKHAKIGENKLQVIINSTNQWDISQQNKQRMPFIYAHTRKACYQYSWDWAPYMNTMGIWLPVHLHFYEDIKINYIWIRNKQITQRQAILDIVLALQSKDDLSGQNVKLKIKRDKQFEKVVEVKSKYSHCLVTINNPQLWWPNNIGQPHIYKFIFELFKGDSKIDSKQIPYGIRTVQLDDKGANFKIVINGYPIYGKGANYVPPDMMYPRLINKDFQSRNTFQKLLDDAVDSNFNMLRVWGGGQYEVDEFYELATRKGIMIFQDFMFSDSIYPASGPFLQTVKQEVIYQVRRLRNYACMVLWSGNNEILQGIYSWGWGQPTYRSNYQKVFKELIPSIINIQSKNLPYIQSSPSKGVGNGGFSAGGDIHYWGVWAAGAPFSQYQIALGGFNSEFGTQSLPVWKSILQFTHQTERSYDSPSFLYHQRHGSQFRTLRNYMNMYSHLSINFEHQAYASGLVQAYGIQIAIRSQRTAKPKSYGTLYWQFNDAWPAISWSSIDYYGRWKPLQFMAKRLYSDIIIFYIPKTKQIIAVSDKLYSIQCQFLVEAVTFDGKVLFKKQGKIQLQENGNKVIDTIPVTAITGNQKKMLVYTQIKYGEHQDNKTSFATFLVQNKNLQIDSASLTVKLIDSENTLQFTSTYLIKSVFIDCNVDLKLSDNYFDVVPGHKVRVKVSGANKLSTLKDSFVFKSYRQIYDPAPLAVNFMN